MTARPPDHPRQSPVLLRGELLQQGHTDRSLARALRDKELRRVRHGAYVAESAWVELDEAERHGMLARAVVKQAGTRLVLSHVSALPEYDAPLHGLDLATVHVTRPDGRAGRREAGVQQHRGRLLEGDVVDRHGLSVTSATRTALNITTIAGTESALVAINYLLHANETTLEAMRARYALGMDHWPHTLTTEGLPRVRREGQVHEVPEGGRVGRRRGPAGEEARGTRVPPDGLALHPDHLGRPRAPRDPRDADPQRVVSGCRRCLMASYPRAGRARAALVRPDSRLSGGATPDKRGDPRSTGDSDPSGRPEPSPSSQGRGLRRGVDTPRPVFDHRRAGAYLELSPL